MARPATTGNGLLACVIEAVCGSECLDILPLQDKVRVGIFFIEGREYCRARAVCQHRNSMVSVSSPGTGEFEAERDEELMQFFLMTPLA